MKRNSVILCFLLATATTLIDGQTKVSSAPVFMMEATVYLNGFGGPDRHFKQVHARNSAGLAMSGDRTLTEAGQTWQRRTIVYPEGVVRSTLDPYRAVTTLKYGPDNVMTFKVQADLKRCLSPGEKMAEEVTLAGIRMYRVTGEDPGRISSRTIWLEGGCIEVESVHQRLELSGKLGGVTTTKLDYLHLSEPPPELFVVPSAYNEQSEAEVAAKQYAADPRKMPPQLVQRLKLYRRLGPGPGGQAEGFVKSHGFTTPDPLLASMKINLQDSQGETKVSPGPAYIYEVSVTFEPLGPNLGKRPSRTLKNVYARNAEGIRVWGVEEPMFVGRGWFFRELTYPEGAKRIAVDLAQSVTTVYTPGDVESNKKRTSAVADFKQCIGPKETLIGEVKLFGIQMYRVTSPFGKDSEETIWPEGGCAQVQSVVNWTDDKGMLYERTTIKLDYLTLGDPTPSLFKVPDSYTEESQTEARAKAYATILPPDKVEAMMKGMSAQNELKQYRKFGPLPGGAAEEFVKKHGFRLPDPNSPVLKPEPADSPKIDATSVK